MNNWKDVPQFFKGFEFINHTHIPDFRMEIFSGDDLWLYEKVNGGLRSHRKEDCTLIARKIDDVNYEEINNAPLGLFKWSNVTGKYNLKSQKLTFEDVRYLLSIEVYPGDQSHFKDGRVIDVKTLSK